MMARVRAIMTALGGRQIFADWFEAFAIEGAALAGRDEEVLTTAPAAVASFRALGSTFAEALAQRGWGLVLANRSQIEEALAHLDISRRLLAGGEVHVEAARTRLQIALVHRRNGDAAAAAEELEAAACVLDAAGATAEVAAARAALEG
jgi:hypothetical protein